MRMQSVELNEEQSRGERLLTVAEARARLSVSERLVWRYLKEGQLPRVRLGGATRIRLSDLERLMREGAPPEGGER